MSGSDSPGPRTASVEPTSGRRRGHDRIAGTGSRPASDRLRGSARRRLHPRTSAGTRAGSWGSQAVSRADPTSCGLLKQRDKHHRRSRREPSPSSVERGQPRDSPHPGARPLPISAASAISCHAPEAVKGRTCPDVGPNSAAPRRGGAGPGSVLVAHASGQRTVAVKRATGARYHLFPGNDRACFVAVPDHGLPGHEPVKSLTR